MWKKKVVGKLSASSVVQSLREQAPNSCRDEGISRDRILFYKDGDLAIYSSAISTKYNINKKPLFKLRP